MVVVSSPGCVTAVGLNAVFGLRHRRAAIQWPPRPRIFPGSDGLYFGQRLPLLPAIYLFRLLFGKGVDLTSPLTLSAVSPLSNRSRGNFTRLWRKSRRKGTTMKRSVALLAIPACLRRVAAQAAVITGLDDGSNVTISGRLGFNVSRTEGQPWPGTSTVASALPPAGLSASR